MSKIAGRIGKDGFPIASKDHHGTAFRYIGDLSPKKIFHDDELEEMPETLTWDKDTGVFPRGDQKII